MKVILTADIKNRGKVGDIIEVNDNFGRNCIIAKGLGIEASAINLNNLQLQNKNKAKIEEKIVKKANEHKEFIESHELIIKVKLGKDNKMFGSVTNKEIANAIKEQFNIEVDKRDIKLDTPIKDLGKHSIKIKLYKDIKAELQINIISNN